VWWRAHASRTSHTSDPVRVPRPAPSFHASCRAHLTGTPWRVPGPAAPRIPGQGTFTPEHDSRHGTHAQASAARGFWRIGCMPWLGWAGYGPDTSVTVESRDIGHRLTRLRAPQGGAQMPWRQTTPLDQKTPVLADSRRERLARTDLVFRPTQPHYSSRRPRPCERAHPRPMAESGSPAQARCSPRNRRISAHASWFARAQPSGVPPE
jgi:hypothetical protein